jgi:phosphatidylglycerol:prolipoprotein diacylglycerol transferase
MYPILARYGSLFIYSFTIILALGVLLATLLTARLEKSRPAEAWFDALLVVFFAALLGGRFGFILGQWPYFQEHPAEIWQIGRGGLAYYGALFAGLVALFFWARYYGWPYYKYAALFSPGTALVFTFAWLACWFDGCAYGRETVIGPFSADLPGKFGVFALRYQTQLIGFLLSLAAFFAILWLFKRAKPPLLFWTTLLLISIAHLIPGLFRGDPIRILGVVYLDVFLDGMLIAVSLLMLQYSARQRP